MAEKERVLQMTQEHLEEMLTDSFNEGSKTALVAVRKMLDGLEELIHNEEAIFKDEEEE